MNKPSDQILFNGLPTACVRVPFRLAVGARAQSSIVEYSDGEHPSKIAGNMVVLNNEPIFPGTPSIALMRASNGEHKLRKSIMERKQTGCVTASLGMPLIYSSYLFKHF